MSYTRSVARPPVFTIHTYGPGTCIDDRAAAASGAWPTTNLAIYVPVAVGVRSVVVKLGLVNGNTVSGNFDVGLYDGAGTRLVSSGSTAQSGTLNEQVVDCTDTTIGPGLYYLAACMDNTTGNTLRRSLTAPLPLAFGLRSEAVGSVTLPATATWTADQTLAYCPGIVAFLEATPA